MCYLSLSETGSWGSSEMLKPHYEVGSLQGIFYFDELPCAFSVYEQLKKQKIGRVWLKDTFENQILANTFGWGEPEK